MKKTEKKRLGKRRALEVQLKGSDSTINIHDEVYIVVRNINYQDTHLLAYALVEMEDDWDLQLMVGESSLCVALVPTNPEPWVNGGGILFYWYDGTLIMHKTVYDYLKAGDYFIDEEALKIFDRISNELEEEDEDEGDDEDQDRGVVLVADHPKKRLKCKTRKDECPKVDGPVVNEDFCRGCRFQVSMTKHNNKLQTFEVVCSHLRAKSKY